MDSSAIASANFEQLRKNPYPGRGLVIGRSSVDDAWLMIYWIMGRSASSRNRKFVVAGNTLRTEPIDTSKMDNPELLIYDAMLELDSIYLVSNGDQTRTIYDALLAGGSFDSALEKREREPDAPHYTPRISGMVDMHTYPGTVTLSILKANPANPASTDRYTYRPAKSPRGLGMGLTTYRGDGNPLPSFSGDPLLLPCAGTAETVLDMYWNALNAENRVALAVKQISAQDGSSRILVRNRFVP
ncbi:MAG TPA: IMP cyclohydrolase [Dictyobacter sp.]|jgi:IMP cyclohydrolase|nr:IMP cyclohydrolase [Dictyobacter sp.]